MLELGKVLGFWPSGPSNSPVASGIFEPDETTSDQMIKHLNYKTSKPFS